MHLQLSLSLADDLYELLLVEGEPLHHACAAERVLALAAAPAPLCEEIMFSLVQEDPRFSWDSDKRLSLKEWSAGDPDLKDVPFVVVDLETTGSRPGPAKITEVGAVRIEKLCTAGTFHSLVNPQRPIPPKISELTGITSAMVAGAPRIDEILPDFLDFIEGAVLVAHNAPFDLSFLNYELTRLKGRRLGQDALDTVRLSRKLAPGLPNHRLATVAHAFGFGETTFHRALADAEATAHVFLTLVGRLQEQGISTLDRTRAFASPVAGTVRMREVVKGDPPKAPGTYRFLGHNRQVLYVGKAELLRERVRSYFIPSATHSRRMRQALRQVESVEWEETSTPLEAVVREQELILEHRPPCNLRGRRPETYVYVKTSRSNSSLRLHAGRTSAAGRLKENGSPAVDHSSPATIGPFRGPTRVKAALGVLERCFPIRRCARRPLGEGCVYRQTGHCLAPCTGDPDRMEQHDHLVHALVSWLADAPGAHAVDPVGRAGDVVRRLALQQRFEEAEALRTATEQLQAVRESYRALAEGRALYLALLWPLRPDPDVGNHRPTALRINVVWGGLLRSAFTVTAATASLEIGRTICALPAIEPCGYFISVEPDALDAILAVRRWILDSPGAVIIPLQEPIGADESRETWRAATTRRARAMLSCTS